MAFENGKSGNPGGRPRKTQQQIDFEIKCRDWSALYAYDKLKKWTDHKDAKVAQWALSELLNRGFGKPVETSIVEANVTSDTGSSVKDLVGEITNIVGIAAIGGVKVDSEGKVDPGERAA